MGYIYKIKNDINNKVYIGKTEFDLEKRFKEHIKDSQRYYEGRPLYKAMHKYGIEHFKIELLEECDNLEERERYWIQFYNSYHYGYNATLGGDGKTLIDYNLVIDKFLQGLTITEIAKELNRDVGHLSKILKLKGITEKQIKEQSKVQKKEVIMLNKNTLNTLRKFNSVAEAAAYCIEQGLSKDTVSGISSHICQCCNGIRKSAYQHK